MKRSAQLILAAYFLGTPTFAEVRTFTSSVGTTLKGELVSVIGDTVTIKKEDGTTLTLKLAAFSRVDQAWLQTQTTAAPAAANTSDPAKATKDAPFENSLGMKFVPVPGTEILFCTHITRRQDYGVYASQMRSVDTAWKTHPKDNNGGPIAQDDDYPVVGVNWSDAKAFCDWLSAKEGRIYRLPTDREWSYAIGIGPQEEEMKGLTPEKRSGKIKGVYPWGTQWPPPSGAGNFADTSHVEMFPTWTDNGKTVKIKGIPGYTDGYPLTSPVFAFKPNKLGIHDMTGNIMQWCEDWFDSKMTKRLARGMGYNASDRDGFVSSLRGGFNPVDRLYWDIGFSGFRCVLALNSSNTASNNSPATPVNPVATMPAPRPPDAPGAYTNSLGMKFVPVKGVPVLFCIHETRRQDYAAYANENPQTPSNWKAATYQGQPCGQQDDHPVVSVSWHEAQQFCAWLSAKEGSKYRLPTDEEWSAAVGLGRLEKREKNSTPESLHEVEKTFYPWEGTYPPSTRDQAGNYPDTALRAVMNFGLEDYTDGYAATAPVMSFKANKSGIYDMGGNVWEWVEDMWNGHSKDRVKRGGCFAWLGRNVLLASSRGHEVPEKCASTIGFRVVLELPKP